MNLAKIQRKCVPRSGHSKHQVMEVRISLTCSVNREEARVAERARRQWWKTGFERRGGDWGVLGHRRRLQGCWLFLPLGRWEPREGIDQRRNAI